MNFAHQAKYINVEIVFESIVAFVKHKYYINFSN